MQKPHLRAAVMVSSASTELSSRGSTSTDHADAAVAAGGRAAGAVKGRAPMGANASALPKATTRARTE
jgi:hypothetical protein